MSAKRRNPAGGSRRPIWPQSDHTLYSERQRMSRLFNRRVLRTLVGPSALLLRRVVARYKGLASDGVVHPCLDGRRLATGMCELNADLSSLRMHEVDDTLQWRDVAIRPNTLHKH